MNCVEFAELQLGTRALSRLSHLLAPSDQIFCWKKTATVLSPYTSTFTLSTTLLELPSCLSCPKLSSNGELARLSIHGLSAPPKTSAIHDNDADDTDVVRSPAPTFTAKAVEGLLFKDVSLEQYIGKW